MRPIMTDVLTTLATHFVKEFNRPSILSSNTKGLYISGRSYVMQDLYKMGFKDEHEFIVARMREELEGSLLTDFNRFAAERFEPRRDDVFAELLLKHLAMDPNGQHVQGAVGITQIGSRVVGKRSKIVSLRKPRTLTDKLLGRKGEVFREIEVRKNEYWPVYVGELQERAAGNPDLVELPEGASPFTEEVFATNPRISNECAILACDAIVDNFDEGAGAAIIRGYTGAQPADPDTTVGGATLLFTLVCSDPAFGAASDDTGKATATAAAITDDIAAAATGTLGYCRLSSTADGATPADDHLDGEAGTSGADYNFNTLAIVLNATVSITAMTVSVPES